METFQKTILIAAVVMLLLALVIIGVALSSTSEKSWPPVIPDCPDYWILDGSGEAATCVNVKNLGTCPPKDGDEFLRMNFNTGAFSGSDGDCAKYNWAKKCGVAWDGITYGVNSPCDEEE